MRQIKDQQAIEQALCDALDFVRVGQLTLAKSRTERAMALLKGEIGKTSAHVRATMAEQKNQKATP